MSIRIPEGYVFMPRRSGLAIELLAAAAEIGADRALSVRTVTEGYHVLREVAEQYQGGVATAELEELVLPDATTKVADIEAFAEEHGVELPDGNKAAKLEAIRDWATALLVATPEATA